MMTRLRLRTDSGDLFTRLLRRRIEKEHKTLHGSKTIVTDGWAVYGYKHHPATRNDPEDYEEYKLGEGFSSSSIALIIMKDLANQEIAAQLESVDYALAEASRQRFIPFNIKA